MQINRQSKLWVLLAAAVATTSALAEAPVSRAQVRAETASRRGGWRNRPW